MDIDFESLMKQAQQMQERMQQVQKEIASIEVVGTAGAGLVTVTLTGQYGCKKISIDEALLAEGAQGKNVLEELVTAAFNDAVHKVNEGTRGKMTTLTEGLDLPKDFKLPTGDDSEGA